MGNDTSAIHRFQKLPVVVDAVRWTGDNAKALNRFTDGRFGEIAPDDRGDDPDKTGEVFDDLHGTWVGVYPGQWIICGVKGEYYPCDDAVLRETYRLVPAPEELPEVLALKLTAEQSAAIEPVDETERVRREAWMAGYQRSDEQWSEGHGCCHSLNDTERDEEYLEWRAKTTAGQEQNQ